MNSKQTQSLNLLIELFAKVRGFNNLQTITDVQANGAVHVAIDQPGFPTVSIGKQGGYDLPEIKSYPENGKESCFAFPGNTAIDAALFGDLHLARQASGKRSRKASPAVITPVPVAVPDPFAGIEFATGQTETVVESTPQLTEDEELALLKAQDEQPEHVAA